MPSNVNNGTFSFTGLTGATNQGNQFRDSSGAIAVANGNTTLLQDTNKHLEAGQLRINSNGSINFQQVAVILTIADELRGFSTLSGTSAASSGTNCGITLTQCLVTLNSATRFIHAGSNTSTGILRITDSIVRGCRATAFFATDTIIRSSIFDTISEGLGIRATFSDPNALDDLTIQNSPYAFNVRGATNVTIKNTTLKNISIADFFVNNDGLNFSGTWTLIDVSSSWNFAFFTAVGSLATGSFKRDYTYQLTLLSESNTPQQNANIRITNLSGNQVYLGSTDSSGKIPNQTLRHGSYGYSASSFVLTKETPHLIRRRKYGYNFVDFVLDIQAKYADNPADELNPFITLSEASSSAITGVSINRATLAITADLTVNPSLTFTQLRHYCHWSDCQQVNLQYARSFATTDGVNFTTNYSLVINGGLLPAPSGALIDFGSRTYSTTNGGSTNAIIRTNAGTLVSLVLTDVVAGSTIRIFSTTGTLTDEQSAGSSTFTSPYTWTADVVRDIGIFRSGYDPFYLRNLTLGNRGVSRSASQTAIREVIYA